MAGTDPRVDAYIEQSAEFAQPILRHLRHVVHEVSPDIEEDMKWSFPHFMYKGILCSMAAFKQHCAFGFWSDDVVPRNAERPETSAMGQFGRIASVADLPRPEVLAGYVRRAMQLRDEGAKAPKAPPRAKGNLDLPAALRHALERRPAARAAFKKFSPSQQREYVEWITGAKREETRDRRITTAVEWIAEGKPRNWKYMKTRG
jgi:uncharacterized protein YdeI (YjbR/CyaY-like superfamily)